MASNTFKDSISASSSDAALEETIIGPYHFGDGDKLERTVHYRPPKPDHKPNITGNVATKSGGPNKQDNLGDDDKLDRSVHYAPRKETILTADLNLSNTIKAANEQDLSPKEDDSEPMTVDSQPGEDNCENPVHGNDITVSQTKPSDDEKQQATNPTNLANQAETTNSDHQRLFKAVVAGIFLSFIVIRKCIQYKRQLRL